MARSPRRKPRPEAPAVEGEWDAFVRTNEDDPAGKAYWLTIGKAWPTDDGKGFAIKLNALPLTRRLYLKPATKWERY